MKIEIIDALIADGYTGDKIADFEMCDHHFQRVMAINLKTLEMRNEVFCTKCACDAHAANMMGLNPENYTNEKLEDLI